MPKQINTKVVTRTRRESDSIKYTLNEATELLSFPFVFNELLTPDSLNTQLGGTTTGGSSSLIGQIIGEGESAIFDNVTGEFIGSLTEINPDKGYWLKPSDSHGTVFQNVDATITGEIRNHQDFYYLHTGANLVSYALPENSTFANAVETGSTGHNSLIAQDITSIIGNGEIAVYNTELGQWTGNLVTNGFTSGSGYWFKTNVGGAKALWKIQDIFDLPGDNEGTWVPCTDVGFDESGTYGKGCNFVGSATPFQSPWGGNGNTNIGIGGPGHSFGHRPTTHYNSILWDNNLGFGTGSLFDSASNDLSGSADGTNDYIVGFFATASAAFPNPACIGAQAWHTHTMGLAGSFGANDTMIIFQLYGDDGELTPPFTQYTDHEQFGIPKVGSPFDVKVYDPRRGKIVSASIHEVEYTAGKPTIGAETILSMSTNYGFSLFSSGSSGLGHRGAKAIKLKS